MDGSLKKIEALSEKAQALVNENRRLAAKTAGLETEVKALTSALEAETLKNADLLNKIKIIKLAQNIGSSNAEDAGVKDLKRKINEYIKEIDHCLTMLND